MSDINASGDHRWGLPRRAYQLYRERGLAALLRGVPPRLAWAVIDFMNRRSLPPSGEGFIIREVLGSKMYLDPADEGLSRDLLIDGIRESENVETIKKELKEGDVAVDIGANIGYFALLEARIVGEKGRVYAAEPVPRNFEILRRNIEANRYTNVEAFQLALGDRAGYSPIYIARHYNLSSMKQIKGYSERGLIQQTVDVEVKTLDDFLKDKPYPNVLRMDVEGYEHRIFRGMKRTLGRQSPLTLLLEFHFDFLEEQESAEILELLRATGFEIADIRRKRWIPGHTRHRLSHRLLSSIVYSSGVGRAGLPPFGNLKLSIDDVLLTPQIMEGRWGGLEVCFKRR